jgi:NADH kinase
MTSTWSPAVRWGWHNGRQISSVRSFSTTRAIHQQRLADLPDKVSLKTGPLGRLSKVINPRESSSITTRVGSSFGGNHSLEWCQTPRNILLIKKRYDEKASNALNVAIEHIKSEYPEMNLIVEPDTHQQFASQHKELISVSAEEKHKLSSKVDLAVTLGGDGTILHVSSLFDKDAVPPVLSFSMGTLGFLLPYREFDRTYKDICH